MKKILLVGALAALFCLLCSCKEPLETETYAPVTDTPIVIPPTDVNKEKAYLNNGVEYIIDSELSCHISGVGAFNGTELIIPETDPFGRVISYIDDYVFKDCKNIKKVSLPSKMKEIHGGAFQGCTGIEELILPEGLVKIETFAFYGCTSLKTVTIPKEVSYIGQNAFAKCSSVDEYKVDEENDYFKSIDGVIYDKDVETLLIYPIGNRRTSYKVQEGVTKIYNSSFEECKYLETVTMASTVENVADHAFRRCSNLSTVTLSKSLKRLGVGSFYECTALKTVNYPGTEENWKNEDEMDLSNTWDRGTGKYTINYEYKG